MLFNIQDHAPYTQLLMQRASKAVLLLVAGRHTTIFAIDGIAKVSVRVVAYPLSPYSTDHPFSSGRLKLFGVAMARCVAEEKHGEVVDHHHWETSRTSLTS